MSENALITVIEVISSTNGAGHDIIHSSQIGIGVDNWTENSITLAPGATYNIGNIIFYLLIVTTSTLSLLLTQANGQGINLTINNFLLLTQSFTGGTLTNNGSTEVSAKIILA